VDIARPDMPQRADPCYRQPCAIGSTPDFVSRVLVCGRYGGRQTPLLAITAPLSIAQAIRSDAIRAVGAAKARGLPSETRGYSSAGPITLTIPDPPAFSFASVVKSRHLSNRAKARYSAS
jgi:hypothetical protein